MDDGQGDASPNEWKPFEHQVAGHIYDEIHGMLTSKNGMVLKPVQVPPKGQREVDFYETIFNKLKNPSDEVATLKRFLPHYYGIVRLPEKIQPQVIESYLQLDDITAKFKFPCVLDIKIGKRTWDHNADEAKIAREKSKCPFAGVIEFKLAGMKVFNVKTKVYDFYDRNVCRKISNVEELHSVLLTFLDGKKDTDKKQAILSNIIIKLKEIQHWFLKQRLFSFASSSVLLVYGADQQDSHNHKISNGGHCEVKMIDFSHVYDADDYDTNYQQGMESAIHHLERCLEILKLSNQDE